LKCFAEFKANLLIERQVFDIQKKVRRLWFEGDGRFAKPSVLKPTLFRCQSQFPARALESPTLTSERQVKVAWKKAWAFLGEKENGIGGASPPGGYGKSIAELSDTPTRRPCPSHTGV
jgi:hypothetical protein